MSIPISGQLAMSFLAVNLCECGCGLPTTIANQTRRARGWIKGQPIRFRQGHAARIHPRTAGDSTQRFWSRVVRSDSDACWFYKGSCYDDGYGQFHRDGKNVRAHRVAYELVHGPLPPGMLACHRCDVRYPPGDISYRRCCNPSHLFAGTTADNAADMVMKGRSAKGDRHSSRLYPELRLRGSEQHLAKLTEDRVIELRARFAAGERNISALSREFGVARFSIKGIVEGRLWRHIP